MNMEELRYDFRSLRDGTRIVLYPNEQNPLHKKPVKATYRAGYLYCDGSDPSDGPDYYWRDVLICNVGFTVIEK